jgi:uncharacterized repeat protein (TIGR03847 family)
MSSSYEFDSVDRITVGTMGPVGERIFLLQLHSNGTVITVKLEKQQVGALCERLTQIFEATPVVGRLPSGDDLELSAPALPMWAIGGMTISWDEDEREFSLRLEELVVEDDVEPSEISFTASLEQMAAFAERGTELVGAGRPPCPLCAFPLDPRGHTCPRMNGHRAPLR